MIVVYPEVQFVEKNGVEVLTVKGREAELQNGIGRKIEVLVLYDKESEVKVEARVDREREVALRRLVQNRKIKVLSEIRRRATVRILLLKRKRGIKITM